MDFTLKTYSLLLKSLAAAGFSFRTVEGYLLSPGEKNVVLRHDVDRLPFNSLATARIENALGITGTYYFRITPGSFNADVMREISSLGHEIGYHYEDLSLISKNGETSKSGGKVNEELITERAFSSFERNLELLRKVTPVRTICMHGSPLTRWDSRMIWKYHDFTGLGIIGEPYFSIDLGNVLYLTDTGRRWNGGNISIRDRWIIKDHNSNSDYYWDWKVYPPKGSAMNMTLESAIFQNKFSFKTSSDIIKALKEKKLSGNIMITFHPQRWNDRSLLWMKEYIGQNLRNAIKYFIVRNNLSN